MAASFDVDKWLQMTQECSYLPEYDFKCLCNRVADVLFEEPNVVQVTSPTIICGDIHGQFYDLGELLQVGGPLPDNSYVFMGDYVDRGYYSLETLTLLLILKLRWSSRIVLLRGNHESRQITQVYGFYDECLAKYGNSDPWQESCRLFDLMPIAAIVDNEIFCVHGGLSPEVKTVNVIRTIPRGQEIPHKGGFCDLVWSDPEEIENWALSPRGAGWLFGFAVTDRFLHNNGLKLICRAHQLVNEGFKYMWDEKLVTVWSAPNYCYRCGNLAAILQINDVNSRQVKTFSAVPADQRQVPEKNESPYFL